MALPERARALVGMLIVAGLSVFGALNSYQVTAEAARAYPDRYGVAASVERFNSAAERLPATGVIGYISDMPAGEKTGDMALLTARYALAPRWLVRAGEGPPRDWALGNFSRPADYAAAGARSGFQVAADLGSGVVIYRRAAP